jgi:hypothetical protein
MAYFSHKAEQLNLRSFLHFEDVSKRFDRKYLVGKKFKKYFKR